MITFVRLETEDFSCRAIPLYEMPSAAVFEALAGEGPDQMMKTAALFRLAVLDNRSRRPGRAVVRTVRDSAHQLDGQEF